MKIDYRASLITFRKLYCYNSKNILHSETNAKAEAQVQDVPCHCQSDGNHTRNMMDLSVYLRVLALASSASFQNAMVDSMIFEMLNPLVLWHSSCFFELETVTY